MSSNLKNNCLKYLIAAINMIYLKNSREITEAKFIGFTIVSVIMCKNKLIKVYIIQVLKMTNNFNKYALYI